MVLEEIGNDTTRFCGSGFMDLKGAEPVRPCCFFARGTKYLAKVHLLTNLHVVTGCWVL